MGCRYCQGKDTQRYNKHHCPPEYAKDTGRKRIIGQRSDGQGPIPYVLPKQAWRKETPNKKVKTYYKLILGEKAHQWHIREDA